MPYKGYISSGFRYIIDSQNPDGGIATDVKGGKVSGCWTTAESLEAILLSESFVKDCTRMIVVINCINYLLENAEIDGDYCYWKIVEGEEPSILSTGHVIFSLKKARDFLFVRNEKELKITIKGKEHLISNYGKWGISPIIAPDPS